MARKVSMISPVDMSRNKDLAGQTVSKGSYNVTYDDQGYATSASNYNHSVNQGTDRGIAAPSADAVLSGGDRGTSYGSSYDKSYMSDQDLASLGSWQKMYQEAQQAGNQAQMDFAHNKAEQLRNKYGYAGGTDGSGYNPIYVNKWDSESGGGGRGGGGTTSSVVKGGYSGGVGGGSFSYGAAPGYINRYQSQIDALTAQILGREAFSYDPETDPAYQQYKESYTRGGERAMQDTLAQMAARTGGLASSYANSVSQQTYDNYMAALADKVPELRQLAYSMYQDEGNNLRDNLSMLASLEQGEYGKFADQLAQYNTDRNFNYGVYRDDVGDQRYSNEWNYQVGRDQIADQRYNTELEYNQALAKAQMLASIGDFSGYKALGYSDAEIANLKASYDAAQLLAQQQSTARRSGGSSGSRGSGSSSGGSTAQNSGIVDTMLSFGNDNRAYEYLIGLGYSNSKTDTLWEMYKSSKGGSGGNKAQSGSFSGFTGTGTIGGDALTGALNGLLGLSRGGGLTVDMASVLGLGYGPISESRLAELEAAGEIESYEDGNKIKFRKR